MEEEKVLKEFPDKQIIIDIPQKLEDGYRAGEPEWIIYKVPNKLRKIRPTAYTPQLVSIGPFHYGKSNLKAMEHYKTKYMEAFLGRKFCTHIEVDNLTKFLEDENRLQRIQGSYAVTLKPVNRSNKFRRRTSSLEMPAPAAADEENKRNDFTRMILRDACFIFELFLRNHETQLHKAHKEKLPAEIKDYSRDYILGSPWLKAAIKQDLILIENQLPYFVLTELFDHIVKEPSQNVNLLPYLQETKIENSLHRFVTKITCEFFTDYYKFGKPLPDLEESSQKTLPSTSDSNETGQKNPGNMDLVTKLMTRAENIKHFTDLIRASMCEQRDYSNSSNNFTYCHYSAKQLDNARVVFGSPEKAKFLADIETAWDHDRCWKNDPRCNCRNSCCGCWINGLCWINCLKLEIPPLTIEDKTECIFRNVMALEQFVYPNEPRICNYIFLLDQLISTVEDVDLLVDKKIIHNLLGSNKAVVDLVNKLCYEIVIDHFFYSDICKKLNDHRGKPLNVARSTLRRVYFKDIWTGSSTLVGLVFLVFSGFSVASTIKNLLF
ncbi:uncharacterized protein LOC112489090 [Ziziphus jujuba]|uniref:Uncharacterized protein LOC112489090 n=1 Tax=Ziziphus jujuba TaxID=326968 RepID=A0ABM3ZVS8_ZIZJJ|nr:uncharacterized protein LOC112489090 [Ziziphus jujuba]